VTKYEIHPLLGRRWSPRAFDRRPVDREDLAAMLEAARWTPSSMNEQPWRFIVATQDEPEAFERMAGVLVDANRVWAERAPVLVLTVAKTAFDRNGRPNAWAWHDTGAALAYLTVEATARGLFVHPMGGFSADAAREAFGIPEGYEPVAAAAIGYPGDPDSLPEPYDRRERAPRERIPLEEIAFGARWGEPARALTTDTEAPALA